MLPLRLAHPYIWVYQASYITNAKPPTSPQKAAAGAAGPGLRRDSRDLLRRAVCEAHDLAVHHVPEHLRARPLHVNLPCQ